MSNPVDAFWFSSTMTGAPTLTGEAGKLIEVLDACLLNGFGSVTLDSVVVASGLATATKSAGHGFTDHGVILIAGATPSGLNGNKRLTRVSSTVFTFDATGISDQTATGTITAKMAPVGWTKRYSDTNKAVYARSALAATAMVLRIDDSPAQYPTVLMYETMSDVNTGTGPAPTSSTYYTCKSGTANNTTRPWRLFADGFMFYFCVDQGSLNQWWSGLSFGDLLSYKSGDAYHCVLIAHSSASSSGQSLQLLNSGTGSLLARASTQTGAAISSSRYSHGLSAGIGYGGNAYPNPVDSGFHAWPVECWESNVNGRGLLTGAWNPLHLSNVITDGTIISNIPQLPGRKLLVQRMSNSYSVAFDLTGPWR